jgi:hypothetical protein
MNEQTKNERQTSNEHTMNKWIMMNEQTNDEQWTMNDEQEQAMNKQLKSGWRQVVICNQDVRWF